MVRHTAIGVTMLRGVEFVERKNTDAFSLSPASVPLCSILSPTAIVSWSDTMKIQKCFMQMIETKQEWFGQHFEVFSWIWGALWLGILNEFVTTRRGTGWKWKDWSLDYIKKSLSWPSGLGADTSRRERSVPARGRFHLGRGGQSVNSMKLYNFSSWEPGKKHQSTCRVS